MSAVIEVGDIVTRGNSKLTWEVRQVIHFGRNAVWYVLVSGQSGRMADGHFANLTIHTKKSDIPTRLEGVT